MQITVPHKPKILLILNKKPFLKRMGLNDYFKYTNEIDL
jgi:hypothetical protein